MSNTPQLKGLAKIWREVKRPFKKIWRETKRPFRRVRNNFELHINDAIQKHCADVIKELKLSINDVTQKHCADVIKELKLGINDAMRKHCDDITHFMQHSITTALLHQKTFSQFKNIHQGQEIVLVACGSTAKDYKRIEGAIHVGVNRAFKIENIDLQYLFMVDYRNVKLYLKEANKYKPESCTKFYGIDREYRYDNMTSDWILPESDVIEANALRFRFNSSTPYGSNFSFYIDTELLEAGYSVVFPAMQFALWTNPRTIYLVGCDCTDEGYFDGQPSKFGDRSTPSLKPLISPWTQLKEFARVYYPETKIISINPVGLKGVFEERRAA